MVTNSLSLRNVYYWYHASFQNCQRYTNVRYLAHVISHSMGYRPSNFMNVRLVRGITCTVLIDVSNDTQGAGGIIGASDSRYYVMFLS